MRLLVRGDPDALRGALSFSTSGMIHGGLLALVVFGRTAAVNEAPRSIYDELIRPEEKRIVWYRLPDRLPDVRPPAARGRPEPLRATRKFEQRIVAGPKDDERRIPQIVWSPAPEVGPRQMAPLPNVIAAELKKPVRAFTQPAIRQPAIAPPVLPDAPSVSAETAPAGAPLRPLLKKFAPPPVKVAAIPKLPEAEALPLGAPTGAAPAGPNLSPLRKTFTPPPVKVAANPKLPEPEAASPGAPTGAAPAGPNLSPLRKTFTPPPVRVAAVTKLPEPEAASPGGPTGAAPAGPNLSPLRKKFTPPAASPHAAAIHDLDPPAINGPEAAVDAPALAIIGLNPSKAPDLPAPPASRTAGFSAGPKLQPKGAETDGDASGITVPGVTVRDGVSRQSLLAAIRPMARPIPTGPPPPTRVGSAPDPTLEGRVVYTLAIQMPNVTSYSGSWMVWFAEREQAAGGTMRAPSPHRKVDPKYIASAAAEGVQGTVRLGAVIRKSGKVDSVKLLRHLDERLDRSAMESLAKWEFEPALRDGAPVDVDAVFEIPFRLAPKPLK